MRRNVELALSIDGLEATAALRRLLHDDLPWLEQRAVHLARRDGRSWGLIARRLARSRQAVWSKFNDVDHAPLPPPLAPTTHDERIMALVHRGRAETRRKREFDALGPHDVVPW